MNYKLEFFAAVLFSTKFITNCISLAGPEVRAVNRRQSGSVIGRNTHLPRERIDSHKSRSFN